jgi:4-carboxymuconolactone decarboxylase
VPRITPIASKSDMPASHQDIAEDVLKVFFGRIRGPFSIFLHAPNLAKRLLPLVPYFRDKTVVEPSLRSLATITAVRECETAYVWAAQVETARKYGLSEEAIAVVRAQGDPAKLPADERDIINYIRQVVRTNRVDQATFDALKSRHNDEWMVELTAAGTYYMFIAKFLNPFEIPPPTDGDKLPG